uniref:Uncharacterized protein n=1 Tax=Molossus molossus TaxID=27622 RepID=A0A7J8HHV5_MOLMO|nr:hypothetical protein HJG59_011022 [Molossus molossus]
MTTHLLKILHHLKTLLLRLCLQRSSNLALLCCAVHLFIFITSSWNKLHYFHSSSSYTFVTSNCCLLQEHFKDPYQFSYSLKAIVTSSEQVFLCIGSTLYNEMGVDVLICCIWFYACVPVYFFLEGGGVSGQALGFPEVEAWIGVSGSRSLDNTYVFWLSLDSLRLKV